MSGYRRNYTLARVRSLMGRWAPSWVRAAFRGYVARRSRKRFRGMSLSEAFSTVYRERLWGGEDASAFSGSGSKAEAAAAYIDAVAAFVTDANIGGIVDLGCGDFRVGRELVNRCGRVSYVGVDIVPEIVENNRRHHASSNITFECRDLTKDELPCASLFLVRQVLQHLSNDEIVTALANMSRYCEWMIVTEHLPAKGKLKTPNADKAHGPDIRHTFGSGVFLDKPPFHQSIEKVICTTTLSEGDLDGILQTVLIRGDGPSVEARAAT